ncbi:MAG: hypothetical protein ABSB53_02085 [Nitrososphaerales archaeon]
MRRSLKYAIVLIAVGLAASFVLAVPVVPFQKSVYHPGGACDFPNICSWLSGYTNYSGVGSVSFYLFGVGGAIGYPAVNEYQFNW